MNKLIPKKNSRTIALTIIENSKNTLCGEIRSLLKGISSLCFEEVSNSTIYTDGNKLYYTPEYILKAFKSNQNAVNRMIIHSLCHCLFLHIFNTQFKNKVIWDISCDIAVEVFINNTALSCTKTEKTDIQNQLTSELSHHIKSFTAENIYFYFLKNGITSEEQAIYCDAFSIDSHHLWYEAKNACFKNDEDEEIVEARSIYKREDSRTGDYQEGKKQSNSNTVNSTADKTKEDWREITKSILRDTENNPVIYGTASGFDTLVLKAITRDNHSYEQFLKRFIQVNEALEINDDEFDYIYYTYGLSLYKNIPLIEPLEYSESPRLQTLIIAIDTSGSVYGNSVKKFIEKTYSILMNTDFFKKQTEIHIIQCDCKIRSTAVIKTAEDIDEYINHLSIKGFGGTDFRPVFEYAESLSKENPNNCINGIIYFTDGDGIYPEKMPLTKSVFVIKNNGFDKNCMPKWATALYFDNLENLLTEKSVADYK